MGKGLHMGNGQTSLCKVHMGHLSEGRANSGTHFNECSFGTTIPPSQNLPDP